MQRFSDRPQTVTNSAAAAGSASEYVLSCTKTIVEEAVNPCDNVKEGNNGSSVPFWLIELVGETHPRGYGGLYVYTYIYTYDKNKKKTINYPTEVGVCVGGGGGRERKEPSPVCICSVRARGRGRGDGENRKL